MIAEKTSMIIITLVITMIMIIVIVITMIMNTTLIKKTVWT